jgi:AAA15 family ATPase/GTPase
MLVQFSVENFLSFDKEQVFSMVAGTIDQRHPEHVVVGEPAKGGSLLRAAAIYGPNGAGKSNLVQAIGFAQKLIVNGTQRGQTIPVTRFKLGEENDQRPSKFEFTIRITRRTDPDIGLCVLYNYGFRVSASRIVEEWLYATRESREIKLFERTTSVEDVAIVETGIDLTGRSSEQKQFFKFLAQGTRPNQLFLSECGDRNVAQVAPVLDWFKSTLTVIPDEFRWDYKEARLDINPGFAEYLADVLRNLGTGVADLTTVKQNFDVETSIPDMPDAIRNDLRERLAGIGPDGRGYADLPLPGGKHYVIKRLMDKWTYLELTPLHMAADGRLVSFALTEESSGTKRLIDLGLVLHGIKTSLDGVFVIDELDRRFHPHLTRAFLQTALYEGDRDHQLIFTTHDTNLLDLDMLRWDEIWFVEKDKGGASNIYPLAEFKVRPDLNIEKGYLNGRFGALPFITPIDQLGWGEQMGDNDETPEVEEVVAA